MHSAQHVAEQIKAAGTTPLLVQLDLTEGAPAAERAIKQHVDKFGRIDVLVNNASTQVQCKDLTEIVPENVEKTLQVNVAGMIFMTSQPSRLNSQARRPSKVLTT